MPEDYPASDSDIARAGNGNLMRFAPVPLFFRKNPNLAVQRGSLPATRILTSTIGIDSSRTTHGALLCAEASRFYTALFLGVLQGAPKEHLLSEGIDIRNP